MMLKLSESGFSGFKDFQDFGYCFDFWILSDSVGYQLRGRSGIFKSYKNKCKISNGDIGEA